MRPAWRLAISTASARPSRTALLAATVALSAAMIAAVACAMSSLNKAIEENLLTTVGRADLKLAPASGGRGVSRALLDEIRRWPEVASAAGQLQTSMSLERTRPWWGPIGEKRLAEDPGAAIGVDPEERVRQDRSFAASSIALGIVPADESTVRPRELVEGRWPTGPGEIAIDEMLAGRLSREARPGSVFSQVSRIGRGAGLRDKIPPRPAMMPDEAASGAEADALNSAYDLRAGDQVRWLRLFREPVVLTVVGIVAQPPLGGRSQAYIGLEDLAARIDQPRVLSQIDIVLRPGFEAESIAQRRKDSLPKGVTIQTSEKITSGLNQNLAGNRISFLVISTMAFLGAACIIMTGLSTGITERQRELAILRCIGAFRRQLAESQLVLGGIIGVIGAVVGVPLGVLLAAAIIDHFRAEVPTGLVVSAGSLLWAGLGAAGSGIAGAMIPAWMASRTSPLAALSARASVAKSSHIRWVTLAAMVLIPLHPLSVVTASHTELAFWLYVAIGIPAFIIGYFLLSVPATSLLGRLLGPAFSRLLRLPRGMLSRTVRVAPYRYGFTAGAMSFGLSLMVGIWAQGDAVLRDWIDKLQFPEAFVVGLNIAPEAQAKLDSLPFVRHTCAITLHPVETEAFGIKGLATYTSTFIAFEPGPFFDMTSLVWVEGDEPTARRRLEEGGAVLVAREFRTAKGLGVGDTFRCKSGDREAEFEIVGVVHSPGLDVISQFFTIGQDYTDQSIHAIFGSRRDLKEKFGSEAIQLIQIGLVPEGEPGGVDDEAAVQTIRKELFSAGIYDAGSARRILKDIRGFVERTLLVSASIGIFAMLVASLSVANIIAAGISARQFEFGVLRSVGASRWLLVRIVLGEVLVVAVGASLVGVVSGLQGALVGQQLQRMVVGIDVTMSPPVGAIAAGCGAVVVICVLAATPSLIVLLRRKPRELLASVRG